MPKRWQGALTCGEDTRSQTDVDGVRILSPRPCGRVGGRSLARETYGALGRLGDRQHGSRWSQRAASHPKYEILVWWRRHMLSLFSCNGTLGWNSNRPTGLSGY